MGTRQTYFATMVAQQCPEAMGMPTDLAHGFVHVEERPD
jgi:hypothetical protein